MCIFEAFSSDFDYPDYDADYEDEQWLNQQRKTLPADFEEDLVLYFETIVDRLEKATGHSINVIDPSFNKFRSNRSSKTMKHSLDPLNFKEI